MHSTSSTEMMLAEGFLDHPGCDVESGMQPLITPSGMGAKMRYESYLTMKGAALTQFTRWKGALGACCVSLFSYSVLSCALYGLRGHRGLDTLSSLCSPATSQKGSGPVACSMLMHLQHCLSNLARRFPEIYQ
jgi:hypothetical protein